MEGGVYNSRRGSIYVSTDSEVVWQSIAMASSLALAPSDTRRVLLWANPVPLECGIVAPADKTASKSQTLSLHVSTGIVMAGKFDFSLSPYIVCIDVCSW